MKFLETVNLDIQIYQKYHEQQNYIFALFFILNGKQINLFAWEMKF